MAVPFITGERMRRRLTRAVAAFSVAASCTVGVVFAQPASASDTTPPTTPGTVTASSVTATSVALTWKGSTDNVGIEGYRVYRGTGTGTPTSLIATTDAVTSYTATKLYSGVTYTFGIMAIDAADNKSGLSLKTVTTANISDTTAPAAPSSASVSAKAFSSSRIDLTWATSSSSDVAGYQVFRDGAQIATIDLPNGQRYSDTGLAAGSTHSYVIKAVDSSDNVSAGTTGRSATTLAAGTVKVVRGPYLSNVTGTAGVVSWWTNIAATGTLSIAGQTLSDGAVQHHAISVSGLSAGTSYPYTVKSGTASLSGTLTTAAPPGQSYSFAAIGDFGGASIGESQNAANIASAKTAFIQTLGDDIYPTSGLIDPDFSNVYSDVDSRFFKQFTSAVASQSFFPANGNKEYYSDGEFWNDFPMLGSNHSWYSYDWGDAHIVVLDSELPFGVGSDQYNFLQADLSANQSAAWRIVAIQRPPYSSSSANSSSLPVRNSLVPLFQSEHVNLVLSGNSHNYERNYPLTNGARDDVNGVTYVVSGGGGNGFNAFTAAQPSYSAFREASYYEYEKVTVSPTSITLEAVRADTNTVFDSATITKPGSTVPAAPAGLTATLSGTSVNLSWTASSAATGYNVYRAASGGAESKLTSTPVTTASYADSPPGAGTYTYTVTAVNTNGESAHSNSASATIAGSGGGSVTLPATYDATIASTAPTTSYGTSSTLAVDADGAVQDFLLKFLLPSTCQNPTAATLTLTVGSNTNNNSAHGGVLYAATPDTSPAWTESVTWSTAPAATGTGVGINGNNAVALGTAYPTVLPASMLTAARTGSYLSFRATTTSTDAAVYVSRQGGANGPSLALTC